MSEPSGDAFFRRVEENLGPRPDFEPICIGPVWQRDADGDFVFPDLDRTGGLQVIRWCADYLRGAAGAEHWQFTFEQARFIMWFYTVAPVDLDDEDVSVWLYRDAVIQKVKGWGKDPVAAVIAAIELCGPSRPDYWLHPDGTKSKKYVPGAKIVFGRLKNEPWVQIFGVAKEQTVNTMSFLQGLFTDRAKKEFDIEVHRTIIYAFGYYGKIESVTSSPETREGNRPSLVIKNEPHHWRDNNNGTATAAVIDRNVNKMRSAMQKLARTLAITNAYDPNEDSHAQELREKYDDEAGNGVVETLYDSIEAPENVPLVPDYTYLDDEGNRIKVMRHQDGIEVMEDPSRETLIEYLRWLLRHLRGDAIWLSPIETAKDILKSNDWPQMRRYYTNAIVTGEKAYLEDSDIRATIHPDLKELRAGRDRFDTDPLRLGWSLVQVDEPIAMFFDGSKSGDSTALVGTRVSDGYTFLIGLWEKPKGKDGDGWLAPRPAVDMRVKEAFETFNVIAFWADPSHAKDDADGTRYWDALIDKWHTRYGDRLTHWAQPSGERRSAIMWDMAAPAHTILFSEAVVRLSDDMDSGNVTWDGHPKLRTHLRNAQRMMTDRGMIIRKPGRNSSKKIDAAVCFVGARMLARIVSMQDETTKGKQAGEMFVPSSFLNRRR